MTALKRIVRRWVHAVTVPVAERAARSYIAGPELADAMLLARRLQQRGLACSVCPWDAEDTPAASVAHSYAAARAAVSEERLDCYVSIKAPSIAYERDLLIQILRASNGRSRLHFDSLGPETADPTFRLISEVLPHFPNLSCTLPGCWRRSTADAEWAVRQNLAVRVVKGQWSDPVAPIDMRRGFLEVIDSLAGRARHVAVATHDPLLAREALKALQKTGTSCELELLYGLPLQGAFSVATEQNVPVRVYIPYGHGWLPYSIRKALRNPEILLWLLRDAIGHHSRTIYSN